MSLSKISAKQLEAEKAATKTLVEATIVLINDLVKILTTEIEVVSARQLEAHKELLKQKQRLTIDYRANVKTIAAQPELLKALPDALRASLKEASQKLADITDRNAKFLRSAVLATQRLIQNIVTIVKQEALPKTSYRNPADAHKGMNAYSPTCKPVAVVRTA